MPLRLNSKLLSNFVQKLKIINTKVVPFLKIYNFLNMNILQFGLVFEI
jgi:hypothetical protein